MDKRISYVPAGLLAGARDARVALALQAVGAAWVALAVLRALWALVLAPLLRAVNHRPVRSYGEWAVVTGATDVRASAGGPAPMTLCARDDRTARRGPHTVHFATLLVTQGIGKAYAFELARRGMKVLLISRTPSR